LVTHLVKTSVITIQNDIVNPLTIPENRFRVTKIFLFLTPVLTPVV
jgi:hypothetical protein